ncbi:thiol reductant ABC exporter subunit CydD [Kineosporiaceae bacterium SCSIO 59966]|nr:thiol reductant ABC exporter subunit CydD [Kineosporiaceae bacterium SCSIO 59966]
MSAPLDPRLLVRARAARGWVALAAALQVGNAALVVVQAFLLGDALAGVVTGSATAASVGTAVAWLVLVVGARALLAGAQERFAHRAAVDVVAELRGALVDHLAAAGPAALHGRTAALTTLATRGLDALDGYLVRYLPQLLATALVTPALLAVVLTQDLLSAVLMAVTLPLVPLFMALVGWTTRSRARVRMARMERLGEQLLDLVAGLPTLRALGRELDQAARVRAVGEAYRRSTSAVLRQAFLSSLVLELFTTLAVALVAVGIGLRLVSGDLDLRTGLVVLVLAPEVYLPLRMVGQHFHASADGIAAAGEALDVLAGPVRRAGTVPAPAVGGIRFEAVGVEHPGRAVTAPADLDLELVPGRVTALVGDSGAGKSTAVEVLLGLRRPDAGRVLVVPPDGGPPVDLAEVDPDAWRSRLAWVPQRPVLVPDTLAGNVRLVAPDATDDEVRAAAAQAGLDEVVDTLPGGWQTALGAGGSGLSAGQRQRVALARALLRVARGAHVVVLDEPTAHLDAGSERLPLDVIARLRDAGCAVLVVAHRPALVAAADDVVTVRAAAAERVPV